MKLHYEVHAGHAVNLEAVDAFDAAVCEFLGQVWSRSAADAPSPD